jgi:rubrerythrin
MKKFIKKVENFVCENCGHEVVGDGYTNHCPKCLYSKHVDINPGDRMSKCGGMMRPIDLEQKNGNFVIVHQCEKCGFQRKNKAKENDDLLNFLKNR